MLSDAEMEEIRDWDRGAGSDADLRFAPRAVKHRRKLLAKVDALKAELAAARAERDRALEFIRHCKLELP